MNWHEAADYAAWLHQALLHDAALHDTEASRLVREEHWQVALPDSDAWEAWARGGLDGMEFPWGNEFDAERANTRETGNGWVSSVGCFPPNGFGLADMAGNVWELMGAKDPDDPNFVLMRGGSFIDDADDARCAGRYRVRPGGRLNVIGLRVVLRSAPVL